MRYINLHFTYLLTYAVSGTCGAMKLKLVLDGYKEFGEGLLRRGVGRDAHRPAPYLLYQMYNSPSIMDLCIPIVLLYCITLSDAGIGLALRIPVYVNARIPPPTVLVIAVSFLLVF